MKNFIIHSFNITAIILLSACSSHIPPEIRQNLEGSPDVAQVREAADQHLSENVRWGGIILNIENKQSTSWLTILASPLSDSGEPRPSNKSLGRFIAIVDHFLEPLVYSKDRKITFTGQVLRTDIVNIGEYPYQHPVIQVDQHYLWPVEPAHSELDHHPYWWSDPWYDPWYDPYYPWHPHRYRP